MFWFAKAQRRKSFVANLAKKNEKESLVLYITFFNNVQYRASGRAL